jgi:hypothetical protein
MLAAELLRWCVDALWVLVGGCWCLVGEGQVLVCKKERERADGGLLIYR